jgi:hypothetical protein
MTGKPISMSDTLIFDEIQNKLYDVAVVIDLMRTISTANISQSHPICGTTISFLAKQLEASQNHIDGLCEEGRFGPSDDENDDPEEEPEGDEQFFRMPVSPDDEPATPLSGWQATECIESAKEIRSLASVSRKLSDTLFDRLQVIGADIDHVREGKR